METLNNVILGFGIALTPENLLYAFIGCALGTLVGVLPGIGSGAAMVILLPITFNLPPTPAIIMLSAIFYGSYYGGTITTVLINVPGEVSSVVTMLDGHKMARQGRGGAALTIAALGSFVGGTLAVIALIAAAPLLAELALKVGPQEFFALLLVGLATLSLLAGNSMPKAIIMGIFGLILGTIGIDSTIGTPRFTFGITRLLDGLSFVPVIMGLFGLSEVLASIEKPAPPVVRANLSSLYPSREEMRASKGPIWRGTLIGLFLGLVPGTTQALASFISYGVEKGVSRRPEAFGNGAVEGVAGPETANNAHANAALIPLFTLGIPGSPSIAILLGAFVMNGLAPGPLLFSDHPEIVWPIIVSMIVGNLMLLFLNVPLVGLWVKILEIPQGIMAALIVMFMCLGTYLISNSAFDVWIMILFGVIGTMLKRLDYPLAPIALTMIVGPLMEGALRQALTISRGDPSILVRSPLSIALIAIAVVIVSVPFWRGRQLRQIRAQGDEV